MFNFRLVLLIIPVAIALPSLSFAKSHHQIGRDWGKTPIPATAKGLNSVPFIKENTFAKKVAKATAWFTQPAHDNDGNYMGSAHLLGHFDNKFVMMTNSHLAHEKLCRGITLEFIFLPNKPKAVCQKVFYRNERLDMALMFVTPEREEDTMLFRNSGINLSFSSAPRFGNPLYTIGFSRHNGIRGLGAGESPKSPRVAYLTRDDQCRVLSRESKLIRNPKRGTEIFKPTHSHSVATGCDAFDAGDCGAIYVDEKENKLIGLYWSEGYYKDGVINDGQTYVMDDRDGLIPSDVGSAATVDVVPQEMFDIALKGNLNPKYLWTSMTYMVPSYVIREVLLKEPLSREPDYACLFQELLETNISACKK